MRCILKAKLLEKEVTINGVKVPILGLASMSITPKRKGLGRLSLELFVKYAEQKGIGVIVGFCLDGVLEFYTKCGWFYCGKYEDLNVISSVPINATFTEKW